MVTVIYCLLNFKQQSYTFTLLEINGSALLSIDIYAASKDVSFDILFLKKPVLWLVGKIKEIVKKLK